MRSGDRVRRPPRLAPLGAVPRVPAPTPAFWAAKLLTTGIGEITSDFFVKTFDPLLVVPAAVLVLAVALLLQLRLRRYVPAMYWTVVLLVGVAGTMAADVLHVALGVPYLVSSVVFVLIAATVFALWWLVERDLDVHDVTTLPRELFYWAAVGATFALGTAVGDLTAVVLGIGYFGSIVLFAVLIAVPPALFAMRVLGPVTAFWCAYVVTRPLGASVADWLAVPAARGGLGLGDGPVSAAGVLLLALIVAVLQVHSARVRGSSAAQAGTGSPHREDPDGHRGGRAGA